MMLDIRCPAYLPMLGRVSDLCDVPLRQPAVKWGLPTWCFMICVTPSSPNMRQAGVDYFRIMAVTGHKTMSAFKRYHTIDHQDLHRASDPLDTYMDTIAGSQQNPSHTLLKS
jgi:hypothetical protein